MLSPYKIGALFGCSFSTITNRMKEYNIPFKSHSLARERYSKKDFSSDPIEKAYMIGFRIGDLNAYKTNKDSSCIVIRCHTTSNYQIKLLKVLFEKYGKVTVSTSGHINCHLNETFDFLLNKFNQYKKINSKRTFLSFFAGYLDAEGYFGINQGKARLKIDSYDKEVLKWISSKLSKYGIRNKCRLLSICKTKRSLGKELWRLNVNFAEDLRDVIIDLLPYSKHRTRIDQMKNCLENINKRLKK